jgi:LysM repeat protein
MTGMRLRGAHKLPVTKQEGWATIIMMNISKRLFFLALILPALFPLQVVTAQDPTPMAVPPTPAEVINAVNALRLSYGIPALSVHSVLMQVAQQQADGIAAGKGGHWRPDGLTLGQWLITMGYPLSGDLSLDGYRSENWGVASTAEEAINMWLGDDIHTNTMLSVERSDIGVGIAVSDQIYVVLETALQTTSGKMQDDANKFLTAIPMTRSAYFAGATQAAENGTLSQYSLPVMVNTASPAGDVYHVVQYGQSLWSIAITYHTTIKQIQQLNNLYDTTVVEGQKLLVVKGATQPVPPVKQADIAVTATQVYFMTPTAIPTPTLTDEPVFEYSQSNMQSNTYSIGAIGLAAIFLGAVFTILTRKKPV